jgi:hypothetical protein
MRIPPMLFLAGGGWMDRRHVARLIFWLALGFAAGVAVALIVSRL